MKKALLILLVISVVFAFASCKKKGEQTTTPTETKSPARQGPIIDTPPATAPGHGSPAAKTQFQIVIPPEVKEQWGAVTIVVEDRQENKTQEFVVNIGDEFKIPDSKLTVKVGPFLPDFKMNAETITSASNEPNNPAVGITVMEDGNKIFPSTGDIGWLYSKFPTIHSFQHERFSLSLKAGTKK